MLLKLLTKNFQYFCNMKFINSNDTICAIATGGTMSAVAVIRVSGLNAIEIVHQIRNASPIGKQGEYHPFVNIETVKHPFKK